MGRGLLDIYDDIKARPKKLKPNVEVEDEYLSLGQTRRKVIAYKIKRAVKRVSPSSAETERLKNRLKDVRQDARRTQNNIDNFTSHLLSKNQKTISRVKNNYRRNGL